MSDERFCTNSSRVSAREALRSIIVDAFATLTAQQVTARLEEAQIANARINEMKDVWNHEQLKARSRWTSVATPAGDVPALLPPGVRTAGEVRMDAVPALGQHTEVILSELGYGREEVTRLSESAVI